MYIVTVFIDFKFFKYTSPTKSQANIGCGQLQMIV